MLRRSDKALQDEEADEHSSLAQPVRKSRIFSDLTVRILISMVLQIYCGLAGLALGWDVVIMSLAAYWTATTLILLRARKGLTLVDQLFVAYAFPFLLIMSAVATHWVWQLRYPVLLR